MRKPSWMLAIMTRQGVALRRSLVVAAMVASYGVAFAGTNTTLPFFDTFESNTFGFYTNGTPLINGTNGWYGSSSNIIVQTNTVYTGTNAAMIPVDCTLSNRFQNIAVTNVWIQMDVRSSFYDSTNPPMVDTNATWLLYINSNGNFVVHNGPPDNPTNSTKWVQTTPGGVQTNGTNWVSLQIRLNYANHTWGLYNITTNDKVLITNNIGFVNPNLTDFAGFDVYNGSSSTSYLDNVSVSNMPATNYFLDVTPAIVTNSVIRGYTTNITLTVTNQGTSNMSWSASTTNAWIQIVGATNGTVAAGGATNLVVMNSAVTIAAGTYTGRVVVSATSADEFLSPEISVVTFVLQVMELQRAPSMTNAVVMQGEWTSNSFEVWNAGPGVLDYYVTTNQSWLVLSPSEGSLTGQTDWATNTIVVTYTNTSGLMVGANYGTITISARKGGSVTIGVTLTVQAQPMLSVSPVLITNTLMAGQNLDDRTLQAWNGSADFGIWYRVTTNQGGASTNWLSMQVATNYLAPLTTNNLTINYAVSSLTSAGDVPSNYFGAITVTATNRAIGSPVTIPVTVKVNPKPRIAFSPTNLSQTVLQGRDALSQGFEIWNANGFYTLDYTISKGATPWLVLTPTSGTSTGQHARIDVYYSTANLPAGSTNAPITVVGWAWDGVHAKFIVETQTIVVAMSVTPFATLTTDAQPEYAYTVRKGVTPPDTVLNVWNGGALPGEMYFTVSPSASWLSVTPASGTSTGTGDKVEVSVQADDTDMKPGVVYSGTVQIDATDAESGATAYGSPSAFTITVVLREFNGFDFQGGLSGASDLVLYREANGEWEIRNLLSNYATTQFLGSAGYQAMPGDYFGDGITDMGVYRSASGSWYAQQVGESAQVMEIQKWAGAEYVGVPGDYDGDGKTDPGVYLEKSGLWMVLMSGNDYQQESGIFGGPGYTALLAGDYDGDVIADPGVYHRASGLWTVLFSTSHSVISGIFGGDGFVPVPTDYDGDDITDPAVYATETGYWHILPSTTLTSQGYSLWTRQFGGVAMSATLVPAPGDYDGVEGADLGLYDTTTWCWYIMALDGVPLAWGYPMGRLGCLPVLP